MSPPEPKRLTRSGCRGPSLTDDERAIRDLVDRWMEATKAGDIATVLDMMTDDVLFMTPGREPFGKAEFRASAEALKGAEFDGRNDIQEIRVLGEWAWMRNRIEVTIRPPGGEPLQRSGYTLTILQKGLDGRWRIGRDANLLPPGGS
jgi:uncharacterized protein (TIGR02246 family)